jgi:hypothetical protein
VFDRDIRRDFGGKWMIRPIFLRIRGKKCSGLAEKNGGLG